MALRIPPYSGQIVLCDYKGFIIPEMVKRRPVVVISPKPRRELTLCAVVPLSTTPPRVVELHHLEVVLPPDLVHGAGFKPTCWAKCDLVNTVSLERLDLIRVGRSTGGKRQYSYSCVNDAMLNKLRQAVVFALTGKY